jgi:hypothetical protein
MKTGLVAEHALSRFHGSFDCLPLFEGDEDEEKGARMKKRKPVKPCKVM